MLFRFFQKNIKLCELQKQLIWNNAYICINGNTIVKHHWIEKGITQIGHLLRENSSFLSYFEVKKKYDFNCHYAEYFSIKCAIPPTWVLHLQNTDLSLQAEETHQDKLVKEIMQTQKVCKFIQKQLVDKIFKSPISQERWSEKLNKISFNWKDAYIFLHSNQAFQQD